MHHVQDGVAIDEYLRLKTVHLVRHIEFDRAGIWILALDCTCMMAKTLKISKKIIKIDNSNVRGYKKIFGRNYLYIKYIYQIVHNNYIC